MGFTLRRASVILAALMVFMARETACAITAFSIKGYPYSNAPGLAVDPYTGSTFFTSLSYGGEHNLFEFNAAGSYVRSARVPFNVFPGGHLGDLVVGGNGNLFVFADVAGNGSESFIEVSRNFSTVLSLIPGVHAGSGMTLNPMSGNLMYLDYRSNYALIEITAEGAFVGSQTFGQFSNHNYEIAYDSSGQKLFVSENLGYLGSFLHEYQRDGLGQFVFSKTYGLDGLIPELSRSRVSAIDYNPLTGKFYAAANSEWVIMFGLDELQVVPEPSVMAMVGLGSLVLMCSKRRSDKMPTTK